MALRFGHIGAKLVDENHVLRHDRHLAETLLAYQAVEWPVSRMGPIVVLQVPVLRENALAVVHFALIGLFDPF